MRGTPAERLAARVRRGAPTECWPWTGGTNGNGYGCIYVDGRVVLAHRLAWELVHGPILKGEGYHGTCVLHRCDTPACCNPAHLFLGTQLNNMQDKVAKDRQDKGEKMSWAKLTDEKATTVRRLHAVGYSATDLGWLFSVTPSCILAVANQRNWRHV